ncbi:MAG: methylaspartate mutase accessory protein GlmL [Bacillota bacterium]|nr:methylaspartate mutase accessory protein GlmL [Bacillota bacterium]
MPGTGERLLLIDFGSTFTKVVAVETGGPRLVGAAQAPTTVTEGIMAGLREALALLEAETGLRPGDFSRKLAASSAAGGLRMVAVGLVPELTVEAARRAALGAGAKLLQGFAYELTPEDVAQIEALDPDLLLLAGGTDGGNREVILHNARVLAGSGLRAPVIVAGNRSAAPEVERILTGGGKEVRRTENVMPELDRLNVEPARQVIRTLFFERIVHAKGLEVAQEFVGGIVMPTPAAVLQAAELLARGLPDEPGLGELLVVDVGGATTDVHSLAKGEPTKPNVAWKGLPEPFAKRTVEGDLGVRVSAATAVETIGEDRLRRLLGDPAAPIRERAAELARATGRLPATPEGRAFDQALARACVEVATERHAGRLETLYTPFGATYLQKGKDLTRLGVVIGTGGPVIRAGDPAWVLAGAVFDAGSPEVLKPEKPALFLDRQYLLAAAGLLAEVDRQAALRLMKQALVPCGEEGAHARS